MRWSSGSPVDKPREQSAMKSNGMLTGEVGALHIKCEDVRSGHNLGWRRLWEDRIG